MNNRGYELIIEELVEILGREPTEDEMEDYIAQMEARWEDNMESHLQDLKINNYNTD